GERDKHVLLFMLRKLISKITQSLKGGSKRSESTRPAHSPKSGRSGGRDQRPRHDKKGGHAAAPRSASAHSPKPAHAAPKAAAVHAPKPLPEVPKLDTSFTALGLGDRIAYAVQQKGYENPTPIQAQAIPQVLT